ncbi:hypothetical protein EF913_06110 [Streptomyces sp. WAC04189]|nr:hypothetical protein EF913_06110 [Streptomyces sp. WAC04189]RSS30962.1 hypothetical protein EF916_05730 [Streptomyces sp. WAC08452]
MIDTGDIDVFLGLDVGKGEHHAIAITPTGEKGFDKRLPPPCPHCPVTSPGACGAVQIVKACVEVLPERAVLRIGQPPGRSTVVRGN